MRTRHVFGLGGTEELRIVFYECGGTGAICLEARQGVTVGVLGFLRPHYMRVYSRSSDCISLVVRHIQGSQIPSRLR